MARRRAYLLQWLLIPIASALAFAVHLPASSSQITLSSGRGAAALAPGATVPAYPLGSLLQRRRRDGAAATTTTQRWAASQGFEEQKRLWWIREGGLGLVRGGGSGDGNDGIIGGGGGGGGGGGWSGGEGQGSSGSGGGGQVNNNGGALVLAAALTTFKSLWGQYAELLDSKPVVTKAITAGLIALVGDILAQLFEYRLSLRRLKEGEEPPPLKLSFLRCLAVSVEGIAITGPGLHYLYSTLERIVPAQQGILAAFTHVAVDEFIFDPLFVLGFFFLCGLIEGKHLVRDIIPQVQREYWPALKGGWAVSLLFLPLEFATFRCLPLRLRVLVVNITDVVWTAVVSYFSHLEEELSHSAKKTKKGKAH